MTSTCVYVVWFTTLIRNVTICKRNSNWYTNQIYKKSESIIILCPNNKVQDKTWRQLPGSEKAWPGNIAKPCRYSPRRYRIHLLLPSCETILTHWGCVTHICAGKLTIIDSDNGLSPVWRQAIMNQCWNSVNWILSNKFQWNCNRYSNIFIQENALEHVVREMASILSPPQCVKPAKKENPAAGNQFPTNPD